MAVRKLGLRVSQGTLNAVQKSAEGEVGKGQAKLVRHSAAERWREQIGFSRNVPNRRPERCPRGLERQGE
jgi:hypothetical protein